MARLSPDLPLLSFAFFLSASTLPAVSLEWMQSAASACPDEYGVVNLPLVVNLTDDDGDGLVTECDVPDVVVITDDRPIDPHQSVGHLKALHGDSGRIIFEICDLAYPVENGTVPAAGDLDGDGVAEIVVLKQSSGGTLPDFYLMAFENDGAPKWQSSLMTSFENSPRTEVPVIADLDGDGTPEVIMSPDVFDARGNLLFTLPVAQPVFPGFYNRNAAVLDLDLDGAPEIVTAGAAYRADGALYWDSGLGAGVGDLAIADFDGDGLPEVAFSVPNRPWLYLLRHDGTVVWGPLPAPVTGTGSGGLLAADFDGDGTPEIGFSTTHYYTVLERDGALVWSVPTLDSSSGGIGASAFDFTGDGAYDIAYQDDDVFHILDGRDGHTLFETPNHEGTCCYEYPTIADVDRDGKAEVIVPSQDGVKVFGDPAWPPARRIWNQQAYTVTNVRGDGTIPPLPSPHWTLLNGFRAQAGPVDDVDPAKLGVVGNTLFCTRDANDVVHTWVPATPASTYVLRVDLDEEFLTAAHLLSAKAPPARHSNAVEGPPANPALFYYRVHSGDCLGNEAAY